VGDAEQRQPARLLFGRQRGIGMLAVIDLALEQLALAAAAGAVAAAIGQALAFAQCGNEDGLVGLDAEAVAAGPDGDLMGHGQ